MVIYNKVSSSSSTRVAEMVKLLENIFRAVNIGLVNEMKIVVDEMAIDILEVIEAAKPNCSASPLLSRPWFKQVTASLLTRSTSPGRLGIRDSHPFHRTRR